MSTKVVIPVVMFLCIFIATLVLTVVVAYVWDKETALPVSAGMRALPPFPTVAPVVNVPSSDPIDTVCTTLVGGATGQYAPSPTAPLRPCSSDSDCEGCHVAPAELDDRLKNTIKCVDANEYDGLGAQQDALGNGGPKFCLPARRSCLPPDSDTLVACTHDAECASCDDVIGDGAAMQCQIVSKQKVISRKNTGGDPLSVEDMKGLTEEDVIVVEPGKWCLPRTSECDAENGVLHWTTSGWTCTCRYPNVHTGDSCNLMKACNNFITTPWSRDKQQLLVNDMSSALGGDPEVWTMRSGVIPELCHYRGDDDRSNWDKVCDDNNSELVRNTVCQCDGLMLGSHMGFRSEVENPLTCTADSCSMNALGGRATEPLQLSKWSEDDDVPHNQCVCSGANSRIWDSDTRNPDEVEVEDPDLAARLRVQEGYMFRGRCNDVTLPHSDIIIRADSERKSSAICTTPANGAAEVTSLVPGYAQDASGNASVSVCAADPCRGMYSDINFAPPEEVTSWGHYDATKGACSCVSPAASVPVPGECNNTVNPVCSTCVNACVGMESENPGDWPCRSHPLRPCSRKSECITGSDGTPHCVCPEGCGNTDGFTCAEKFMNGESCYGYVGVPNICTPSPGENHSFCKCHKGRKKHGGPLSWTCKDTDSFYAKCTGTTSDTPKCSEGDTVFGSCAGSSCPDEEGCDRFHV